MNNGKIIDMDRYSKLLNNTIVLFVANFGSRILSFLLVPLYTHLLSTDEYGVIDIVVTTASVLVPLITASISEATFRFSMDKDTEKNGVFTNSVIVVFVGGFILFLFLIFISSLPSVTIYMPYLFVLTIVDALYLVITQFCRGNGFVKMFAIAGVAGTITLISSNLLFLLVLDMGIRGYLLSVILSFVIPIIIMILSLKLWKYFGAISLPLLKRMILYSLPMIPNALAWLVITSSDKYCLAFFSGPSANGIYVVSQKIPGMINIIGSVFMQAWQISATETSTYNSRSVFYSRVFNLLSILLLTSTSAITMVVRPLYSVWLDPAYYESWKYTTVLLLANVFSCFSSFVGTNYIVMKRTIGNLKTNLIGCVANIILNLLFIPLYGIMAAAVATMISFAITWIARVVDTKTFVKYEVDYKRVVLVLCIIACQLVLLFVFNNLLIQVLCFLIVAFVWKNEIVEIYSIVAKRFVTTPK